MYILFLGIHMVEAKNNRDIAFSKVVQRTVILGIIIGIVIGGAIISFVPTFDASLSEELR